MAGDTTIDYWPGELLRRLHIRRGEVAHLPSWPQSYTYFFSPSANEFVFAHDHLFRWREAFKALIPVDGETALIVSDGADHTRRRALVRPGLHRRQVASYVEIMARTADEALDAVAPGQPFDAYAVFRQAIRRSTMRSLFGERVALHEAEVGENLQPLFDLTDRLQSMPLHERFRTPLWRRAMAARDRLDHFVHAEIARARNEQEASASPVLATLVHGRHGADGLSDLEVRDQAVSMIAAGYETTSGAMAWTLHAIGTHPQVMSDVRDEIRAVSGDQPPRAEELPTLPLLNAVVSESLRLYPPATITARHTAEEFDYAGRRVKAGQMLILSPYVTHRSPDVYDRPRDFLPERWLDGARRPPSEYLPFGGGAHRCIGSTMATTELAVMLARLLARGPYTLLDNSVRGVNMAAIRPRDGLRIRIG
jgi:cytochrome P450